MKPLDPTEFARAAVPQPDPVRLAIAADPPRLAVVPEQRPLPALQEVPRQSPKAPEAARTEPQQAAAAAPLEAPPATTPATPSSNPSAVSPRPPAAPSGLGRAQASRAGKVQVQTWVSEEKRRALKMAAVQSDRTIEELLNDAIDLILGNGSPRPS
jgi:hypothetical protein